ncbi:MAG: 4-hydroxy-tetrahydrodipicolinate synthase [Gaiellaceae bacterium]
MLGEVLTAVVTPFAGDGSVNLESFRRLCGHLVDNGSDGVVVAGTTGESPTLTDEERLELFAAAVESVGDRATVIAGTGTYSTAHSVHLTEKAHALGVDAFLVVTPYYNKPPVRGIVAHFAAIAEATDKPIVVYNIPQRVVLNLEPETLAELAEIPNVSAVKQATTDPEQARRIVHDIGLALYAGNDDLLLPFLELGGLGGIFVYTHLVGPQVKEVVTRYREGDRDGARALDRELRPIVEALAVTTNPIPVKAALNMLGHDVGGHRLPLVEATAEEERTIRGALERAGVLAAARA